MNTVLKPLRYVILFLSLLIAIVSQAQHLRSVLTNACSGSGSEGENEYLVLHNSGSSFELISNRPDVLYGSSFPASTSYTDSISPTGNPGYVNGLNAYLNGTCDFIFHNLAYGDTFSQNRYLLLMYHAPTDTPDFNAWCGNGLDTVFVAFSEDPSWKSTGNFVNAPSSYRFFQVAMNADTQNYSYTNGWSSNADGNTAVWADTGTASAYVNYPNCNPINTTSLPVELVSFEFDDNSSTPVLVWSTASEVNNSGFWVERSESGEYWEELMFVPGHGTSLTMHHYQQEVLNLNGQCFFRLRQEDFDGTTSYSKAILWQRMSKSFYSVDQNRNYFQVRSEYEIELKIVSANGIELTPIVEPMEDGFSIVKSSLKPGIYYLRITGGRHIDAIPIYIIH